MAPQPYMRPAIVAALVVSYSCLLAAPSHAISRSKAKATAAAAAKDSKDGKSADAADGVKRELVGEYADWGAYRTRGAKNRTCYALARPKERLPANLKRDPAYIFISTRPGENVKNEVSIILGFAVKDGVTTSAEIGDETFELLGKGTNAWVKNPAEEPKFVASLRKGSKLTVKMPSAKGNVTTDNYSLNGLGQALDKIAKECL